MISVLESIIGPERYTAAMRGESTTLTGEEVIRFQLACDQARDSQICQSPCLFRDQE